MLSTDSIEKYLNQKWLIAVIFSFFLYSCQSSSTENTEELKETEEEFSEVNPLNSEVQQQVGYLKLDSSQLSALSPSLRNLHNSIVQNTNYGSGISIANIMEEVNIILNEKMDTKDGAVYEKELTDALKMMKGNPRVSAKYFNESGRWLLRKYFTHQSENYPSLAAQVSTLKSNLGEVDPRVTLVGKEKEIRSYIDQCFVVLYLMEVKDAETTP